MKAPGWPAWEDVIDMDLNHLPSDVQLRHWYEPSYHPSMMLIARHNFPGLEKIKGSYSQSMQDIFVLTLLNGKTNGVYLELGSFDPLFYNNTFLLTKFGWNGISIDIESTLIDSWRATRPKNIFLAADALKLDYGKIFEKHDFPDTIDYLQIDIDQGMGDVAVLTKLIDTGKTFSIITFEHENDHECKAASKQLLEDQGYELLAENIVCKDFKHDQWHVFEDWWVNPKCIDSMILKKFKSTNVDRTYAFELFCKPGSIDHLMVPVLAQKNIW